MESRNLSRLPPFDKESGALNIIVQTPQNGGIKYKYNEKCGMFQFDKTLPYGFSLSFDFGFWAVDQGWRRGPFGRAGSIR